MASGSSFIDELFRSHVVPENVKFSVFTPDELRSIGVVKIRSSNTADPLGHPIPYGLYDKRMGPLSFSSEPCGTCNQNLKFCPGHFGYVEFPLPVVNPFFHKIIGRILRVSCLSCGQIDQPEYLKRSFVIEMKLLDRGLLTEALELHVKINDMSSSYGTTTSNEVPEDLSIFLKEYEDLCNKKSGKRKREFKTNKNIEQLRNQFIDDFFQPTTRKICLFCRGLKDKLQVLKNKIIIKSKRVDMSDSLDKFSSKGRSSHTQELKFMTPKLSRDYLRQIWKNDKECLQYVLSAIKKVKNMEHPTDCFYFNIFLIAPPCFRPTNMVNGRLNDHPLTKSYKGLIESNMLVYTAISALNQGENSLQEEAKVPYSTIQGSTPAEKLNSSWDLLQISVNGLMDKELCRGATYGLKQFIEKKEGLIRQNMMGKRVNFSARSVITPDPNLSVDEIGIPEEFAKTLTYPVPVTPWNVAELQKLVMNGPKKHPGAYLLQKEKGNAVQISATDTAQRKGLMKSLLTPDDVERNFNGVKIVHRHLQNGDIVLVNRQPTLHKPSIMAHKVRILKGEKTLRLHYANCKSYNADFDGDEMNIHFPQSELARSESYNLVNVGNQYLVPKDGTPLSGLIQDHIIAAVQLSVRGRFFTRADYYQLVYQALAYKPMHIKTLDPAIIKPRVMWSGKQIISTVLINVLPGDRALINLTTTSKIKARTWETDKYRSWKAGGTPIPKDSDLMSEAEVIIRQGELLSGILDKAHLGSTPFGMIHCINELYGGNYAVTLLSCFSRLLTGFQQIVQGFTLGVEDILVRERADRKRRKVIEALRETDTGKSIITEVLGLSADTPEEEIVKEIQIQSVKDPKLPAAIDRAYKKALDSYTKDINEICVPNGLISKFPHNNLQLMVQSGAKGSSVNTNQISALLGQIELEGKRPPKMINGKSLPCFPATEFSPRSGGFIDGRFMTGIKPQEMFFHCMAGREGLIDTAVKTSRSGYLQRCLVKHLEGLTVGYDMTVRDSDGTLVQTQYGEDGMDILKVQFLNKKMANFMAENSNVILNASVLKSLKDDHLKTDIHDYRKKIKEWKDHNDKRPWISRESPFTLFCREVYNSNEKNGNGVISKEKLLRSWSKMDDTLRYRFEEKCRPCPDPVSSVFLPGSHFGVINERLEDLINNTNLSSEEKIGKDGNKNLKKTFKDVIRLKAMQALCSPGEAVGLLAAQSIGEPSTQMTLNTFHFAGRGDMNVTLGIPRLREILMMASKNLKTPAMEIPFLDVPNLAERAEQLRKKLNRVVLFDILEKIEGSIQLDLRPNRQNTYEVKLFIHPYEIYKSEYCVKQKQVLNVIRKKFFSMLHHTMTKRMSLKSLRIVDEGKTTLGPKGANKNVSDDENEENQKEEAGKEDSSDEEPEDSEDAKMAMKYQQAHEDQDPEDEEWQPSEPEDDNEENDETKNSDIESRDESNEHVRYSLDQKHYRWFKITFGMLLQHPRICNFDLLLKEIAERCVIWETPNIKKAITYDNKGVLTLRTDGINIEEMSQYYDLLDLKKLHCNDVHKMAETYGIDAAKQVIVKEVRDVFEAYSITVDPRHLSLVADYMTSGGTFEPLSRKGMESGASPLQQISFEASGVFLKEAAQRGKKDRLTSPTGSIMVGGLCKAGTGACAILNDNLKMSSVR